MYKLFISNFNTHDTQEVRQVLLLNLFTILAFTFSAMLGLLNFFITHDQLVLVLNILGMFVAAGIFLDLHGNKNIQRASVLSALGVLIYFTLFVVFNKNDNYGLFWVSAVPVFIIGLVGVKKSPIYLIPYFTIVFFLAYTGIGEWQNGQWSSLGFVRLVAASLLVTLIAVMMDLALIQSNKNYETLSSTDVLTNINNRRKIQEIMSFEMQRAERYNKDLGLILFDIDDFKKINDQLGHKMGDEVLKNLTKEVKKSLRSSDSFGRWGGEEFLIIIPEIHEDDALVIAEKIRLLVSKMDCNVINNLSCSFGVAIFDKKVDTQDSFIDRADKAMYEAKNKGKNRVELLVTS